MKIVLHSLAKKGKLKKEMKGSRAYNIQIDSRRLASPTFAYL